MKKYRKINLRKESPAKFYYAIFAAVAAMAWGFSQVPPKKPVQQINPVILTQPSQKPLIPKNKAERQAIVRELMSNHKFTIKESFKPKTNQELRNKIAEAWQTPNKDGKITQLKVILEARK